MSPFVSDGLQVGPRGRAAGCQGDQQPPGQSGFTRSRGKETHLCDVKCHPPSSSPSRGPMRPPPGGIGSTCSQPTGLSVGRAPELQLNRLGAQRVSTSHTARVPSNNKQMAASCRCSCLQTPCWSLCSSSEGDGLIQLDPVLSHWAGLCGPGGPTRLGGTGQGTLLYFSAQLLRFSVCKVQAQ